MEIKVVINKALEVVNVLIESPNRRLANEVRQRLSEEKTGSRLRVKTEMGIQFIQVEAIEVFGDEVELSLVGGEIIKTKGPLYKLKDELDEQQFVQISKSVIVNLKEMTKLENSFSGNMVAYLKSGKSQSVSRRYLPTIKKTLGLI